MDGDDTSLIDHFNPMTKKPESSHPEQEQDRINEKPESSHPEQEQDRISALPDDLLAHILSLLPDTKEAIRTSTLSKRWRPVWTLAPNLTFCLSRPPNSVFDFTDYSYLFPPFAKFVDDTLDSCSSVAKIDKFRIVIHHYYMEIEKLRPSTRIDAWIDFAVLKDVKKLILDFDLKELSLDIWSMNVRYFGCYKLPQILYDRPSLTVMKTRFCDMVPEGTVNWQLLRVLEIGYANLNPTIIRRILNGSPALESLKLFQCLGIQRLLITSEKLKRLVVDNIWLSGDQRVYCNYFVYGPFLQNLQISSLGFHKWKLMNVASLRSVGIDFEILKVWQDEFPDLQIDDYEETCTRTVENILEKVGHVQELKLGKWCIRVLSSMEIKGLSSPSLKCKSLALQVRTFCERDLPGIASLLRSSSELERIEIDLSSIPKNKEFDIHTIFARRLSGNDYWTSFKQEEQGLLSNLKTVEIFGFTSELYDQGGLVFEFIAFLVKRAKFLKKMVIRK